MAVKQETAEMADLLRLAQRVIDLADGDPAKGDLLVGSPLAIVISFRGTGRWCRGIAGWKDDFHQAVAMARAVDPLTRAGVMYFAYLLAIPYGVLLPDATALRDTADTLATAEQSGDDFALSKTAKGRARRPWAAVSVNKAIDKPATHAPRSCTFRAFRRP
jgi:adenylate cyclase